MSILKYNFKIDKLKIWCIDEGEFKLSYFELSESEMNEIMLASKRCKKVFFGYMRLKAFKPCNFEQIDESCIETIYFGVG